MNRSELLAHYTTKLGGMPWRGGEVLAMIDKMGEMFPVLPPAVLVVDLKARTTEMENRIAAIAFFAATSVIEACQSPLESGEVDYDIAYELYDQFGTIFSHLLKDARARAEGTEEPSLVDQLKEALADALRRYKDRQDRQEAVREAIRRGREEARREAGQATPAAPPPGAPESGTGTTGEATETVSEAGSVPPGGPPYATPAADANRPMN